MIPFKINIDGDLGDISINRKLKITIPNGDEYRLTVTIENKLEIQKEWAEDGRSAIFVHPQVTNNIQIS